MITQFELSAYGVEEMNKQEMINVDGGNYWGIIWKAIELIGGILGIAGFVMECTEYEGKIYQPGEVIIPPADSIKIHSDGTVTIYGSKGNTTVPYSPLQP